jgi:hypothetical protein
MFNRDLSKGSAELLVLTLLEARPLARKSQRAAAPLLPPDARGSQISESQRSAWDEFVATMNQIVRPSHA